MILFNEDEKRKIIMDYYINRRNRVDEFNNPNYESVYLHSSSCVDEIKLFFNHDKTDFKFISQGCAIFLSSCEIFIEEIKNKGFKNNDRLIKSYENLVNKIEIPDEEKEYLGKLNIYENVSNHLNRKECALMICNTFKKIK